MENSHRYGHEHDHMPDFTDRFLSAVMSVTSYNDRYDDFGLDIRERAPFADLEHEPRVYDVSEAETMAMEKEVVLMQQTDELADMGITLYDPRETDPLLGGGLDPNQQGSGIDLLEMIVTDKGKFEATLRNLDPASKEWEVIEASVDDLLMASVDVVRSAYPYRMPEELEAVVPRAVIEEETEKVVSEQLNQFTGLNRTLTELGFNRGPAYAKLAEYSFYHATGKLEEHRLAEDAEETESP